MARIARVVIPGFPHHITQRGNRRQQTFFNDGDYAAYLWLGRFASFVMDEPYLIAAARYVELNPVRARVAVRPEDWPWSSARAHLTGQDDCLVMVDPLLSMIGDWRGLLNSAFLEGELEEMRRHSRTGRPLGAEAFLDNLEGLIGRVLKVQKGGRPKKN